MQNHVLWAWILIARAATKPSGTVSSYGAPISYSLTLKPCSAPSNPNWVYARVYHH